MRGMMVFPLSLQQSGEVCQRDDIDVREGRLSENALYEAVCIEDNLHCSLFELMKIHLVDLVESLLVKFPRLPQRIKAFLHPCRIVAVEHILQFVQSLLTLVEGEHLEQMYLQRVKYSCVHNPIMFGLRVQRYKINEHESSELG